MDGRLISVVLSCPAGPVLSRSVYQITHKMQCCQRMPSGWVHVMTKGTNWMCRRLGVSLSSLSSSLSVTKQRNERNDGGNDVESTFRLPVTIFYSILFHLHRGLIPCSLSRSTVIPCMHPCIHPSICPSVFLVRASFRMLGVTNNITQ